MTKINDRYRSFLILKDIFASGAYSNISLRAELNKIDSEVSKSFVTKLVYGVVERKNYLDYIISKLSSTKLEKMDIDIVIIMEMALYQIIYMDKVPESAAVNEAVNLTKSVNKRLSGFVNANLRNFLRNKDELVKIDADEDQKLAIKYSLNEEFLQLLKSDYDTETVNNFLKRSMDERLLNLRVNTKKTNKKSIETLLDKFKIKYEESEISIDSLIVYDKVSDVIKSLFKQGYVSFQDATSASLQDYIKLDKGDKVLDLCAAPGGKTMHMAEKLESGSITSCDIYEHKINLLKNEAKRLGLDNIYFQINDAMKANKEFINKFDKVLLDVPCSGSGIISRKPEIKYQIGVKELKELNEKQWKMLNISKDYVKKGGLLVYSTCSILKLENEMMLKRFLEENNDFTLEKYIKHMPTEKINDGFFISYLRKE
jgi:16S rRNA (cytosine967-C5)-methyltransferase